MSPMDMHGWKTWITTHRRITAVAIVLAAVAVAASLHLLQAGNSDRPNPKPSPTVSSGGPTSIDSPEPTSSNESPTRQDSIPPSEDPDMFARSVTKALFAWDTTSTNLPNLTEQLLTIADPTGEETPGLLMDLRTYLPSSKAWTHLAQYQTRQWLEVTDVVEPATWQEALAQAPAGAVVEGTTARTVTGVRHRAGTSDGAAVSANSPVQFTIFMVCAPAYDQCHLLRLSTSDAALH